MKKMKKWGSDPPPARMFYGTLHNMDVAYRVHTALYFRTTYEAYLRDIRGAPRHPPELVRRVQVHAATDAIALEAAVASQQSRKEPLSQQIVRRK